MLLLDEPTNDLDLDGLARLERFVQGLRSPAVIVSHDREFLARTVNRIVELDLAQQQVGVYDGGYEAYLAEREVARRHAREAYEEYDDKLDSLKARAQTQRTWMAQGVRNARRKSKDNDKIGRNKQVETSEKQAAKARQTERAIERLEVVEEPRKEWELRMTIAAAPRSGTVVASATGAVVRRGTFTLGPVDAQVRLGRPGRDHRAERLGQDHAARRAARPDPGRFRHGGSGVGRAGGRDRPGARAVPRPRPAGQGVRRRHGGVVGVGRAHAAGQVRPRAPTTRRGPRTRCRPASAPGRRWRCCRPAR